MSSPRESMKPSGVTELPRVTIIVPAYNEATRIRACLASLRAQDYPADKLEIIVVDNGSTDDTFDILRATPGIRALRETTPGSYAARNLALESATGEVVCFTDADCSADPAWVRHAVGYLGPEDVGIVAGHVELDFGHRLRLTAAELFERCFSFKQAENARRSVCVTANWTSRRSLIRKFGGFDASVKSGGDHRLAAQIAAAGLRVVYARDAIVRHPARTDFQELTRKRRRVIGGVFSTHCRVGRKTFAWFVGSLVKETLLRLRSIFSEMPLPASDRLRVGGLLVVLCGVSVAEALRLRFGGEPQR
jgi:cellulose synthase/poly-beta-1,6-N-acetylglucosamine synthase-like glycosyltransferase